MPVQTALLDASVLYSASLRDFLMYLALADVVRFKWTAQIHQEWMEAVLRVRPDIARTQLERTRTLMDDHILDALIEDYEHRIDGLWLPDKDDRHVLAAAIQGGCDLIITFNLRDCSRRHSCPAWNQRATSRYFLWESVRVVSACGSRRSL